MSLEKKLFTYMLSILVAILLFAALPVAGEEALYDNVLRLHVIANSDSEEDQALKLAVRDEILSVYGERLAACTDKEQAAKEVERLAAQMTETAKTCVRRHGYDYDVKLSLSREDYPTKVYENVTMPAGNYCSLRIVLGEGEGQNWWCVLFPPMCVGNAVGGVSRDDSVPVGLTTSQYRLITGDGKYAVKFKVLEFVESLFD